MNQFDPTSSNILFQKRTPNLGIFVMGAACGLVAMFFLDPSRGKGRRALMRDQLISLEKTASRKLNRLIRDLRNRAYGVFSRYNQLSNGTIDDSTLDSRVRSVFGRVTRHPRSVKTSVSRGVVTISGPILADEVSNLLERIRSVSGVQGIINQLDVYETSKGISSLQGDGPEYLQ